VSYVNSFIKLELSMTFHCLVIDRQKETEKCSAKLDLIEESLITVSYDKSGTY